MQYRNFRQFSSKPPVFGRGQNDRFPKRPFRLYAPPFTAAWSCLKWRHFLKKIAINSRSMLPLQPSCTTDCHRWSLGQLDCQNCCRKSYFGVRSPFDRDRRFLVFRSLTALIFLSLPFRIFLALFSCEELLVSLSVSHGFGCFLRKKILVFFVVLLAFFQKCKEKKIRAIALWSST